MPSRLPDNTQNSLFTFWVPLPSFGSKELESKSQLSEFKIKSSFLSINSSVLILQANFNYFNVPNKRACMFISGKVCLLTLIEPK